MKKTRLQNIKEIDDQYSEHYKTNNIENEI